MNKLIQPTITWMKTHWRGLVITVLIISLAIVTLSLQLSSLVPGQNKYETQTLAEISKFPTPWHRAVNAPYMIVAYLFGEISGDHLYGARVASVMFGLAASALMYYIIRTWFNSKVAVIGTLLFVTSSWLLHTTHLATPLIMLVFGPLLAVAPLAWFMRTKKYKTLAFMTLAVCLGISAYIPYMLWLIAIAIGMIIYYEKDMLSNIKSWQITAAASIYAVLLLPLLVSLSRYPGQSLELLGLSKTFPTIGGYFSHLIELISSLFLRSPALPEMRIGHLPDLEIFSATMLILGVYYLIQRASSKKSIVLFAAFTTMMLILPFSPNFIMNSVVLLPLVYIAAITGIVELINQWFTYFPRNPLARNIGIGLLVFSITITCAYHLENYFVAWPNVPETKSVYVVKS
jgi:hypothetical protein